MSALQPVRSEGASADLNKQIFYVCGGRNFSAARLGNKITNVVRCWRELGLDVSHICGGDLEAGHSVAEPAASTYGAQAHYAPWYRAHPALAPLRHSLSEWRDMQHDRLVESHLRSLSESNPPALICERSARLHKAGLTVARALNVPYVLEWKDNLVNYGPSLFRAHALRVEAEKERQADWIIVESQVLKDQLAEGGLEPGKILVAHNAVDSAGFAHRPSERERFRRSIGIDDDHVLVGYLGSYAWYHDTPRLIEAAAQLQSRFADRVRIVLVGAGRDRPACEGLVDRMGLAERVIFHDPISPDAVPNVLSGLDIAVLPGSTDIICPIKIQEYMAAGLPTVAPDYRCNREVLEDGVHGLLFRPGDASDLAAKLAQLAEDAGMRHRMGEAARQSAVDRFSWPATWGAAMLTVLGEQRAQGRADLGGAGPR